jgi:cyclophilin family peptidyl-prolyl cis-trans isomerase
MRPRILPIAFAAVLVILIGVGLYYSKNMSGGATPGNPGAAPGQLAPLNASSAVPAAASPAPSGQPALSSGTLNAPEQKGTNMNPDLNVDANGLSKATVILKTTKGVIKFKFYPKDAPGTVARMIELINKGFYNGLIFHRVVPGFVIQGGDPLGNGMGGSGQKLKAEFNDRRHIEGTVAMARAADPDSADSQFYISLGTHPHLDRSYTVFGQVIEGMEAAKQIQIGDKILSETIE